ncbi:hypothetical protein M8494_12535 [Serratia ureilytica]
MTSLPNSIRLAMAAEGGAAAGDEFLWLEELQGKKRCNGCSRKISAPWRVSAKAKTFSALSARCWISSIKTPRSRG